MQVYSPTLKGPLKIAGFIDPDDITNVTVLYGAAQWTPNTVYRMSDICAPTQDNGYYYQCTINGKTNQTEPTWNNQETQSGTATFIAVPYDLWLLPDQTIITSQWTTNNPNITLSDPGNTTVSTTITVSNVPANVSEFEITNRVVKSTNESISRTFKYKTNQQ